MGPPQDARFTDEPPCQNREPGHSFLARNYDLCRAINITSLGVVLDELVGVGMPKEQAECIRMAAYALLQLARTENNRVYADAILALNKGGAA
jgi:hypothetical protein